MRKCIAFLVLAALFVACTPESLESAFTVKGASGNITVDVFRLDGAVFTDEFVISGFEALPGSTVSYSEGQAVISFQAAEGEAVKQTSLTLTVSGTTILKSKTFPVIVPTTFAGGHSEVASEVMVGELVDNYFIDTATIYGEGDELQLNFGYLYNPHYSTYAYSYAEYDDYWERDIPINTWYVNDSDMLLSGQVDVDGVYGHIGGETTIVKKVSGFEKYYDAFVDRIEQDKTYKYQRTEDFTVSAWAMWNFVFINQRWTVHHFLYAFPRDSFDPTREITAQAVEPAMILAQGTWTDIDFDYFEKELPYPEMPAHAHYEEGHGHGHGGDNAGGGIIVSE